MAQARADLFVLTREGKKHEAELTERIAPAPLLTTTDGAWPILRGRIVHEYPGDRTLPEGNPGRQGRVQVLAWGLEGGDATSGVVLLPTPWIDPVDEMDSLADIEAAFGDVGVPPGSRAWCRAVRAAIDVDGALGLRDPGEVPTGGGGRTGWLVAYLRQGIDDEPALRRRLLQEHWSADRHVANLHAERDSLVEAVFQSALRPSFGDGFRDASWHAVIALCSLAAVDPEAAGGAARERATRCRELGEETFVRLVDALHPGSEFLRRTTLHPRAFATRVEDRLRYGLARIRDEPELRRIAPFRSKRSYPLVDLLLTAVQPYELGGKRYEPDAALPELAVAALAALLGPTPEAQRPERAEAIVPAGRRDYVASEVLPVPDTLESGPHLRERAMLDALEAAHWGLPEELAPRIDTLILDTRLHESPGTWAFETNMRSLASMRAMADREDGDAHGLGRYVERQLQKLRRELDGMDPQSEDAGKLRVWFAALRDAAPDGD